ncbi:Holo-[acyl-carrier-protein] synthase [Candidatus Arcanobacter lacustris]|uniref:Holo-[acyl-carrier-protein] synthase n=1 Tax=Candidatus Arcanibacter lacustris TaxID=1607817 RepID=A0A0F5MN05_9RICK|nr:Holo-[acyl-carrier-protein] synthase [Candidatus Arcanobacter lacustris]
MNNLNIVGIGNDIINITRIEKSIAKFGDKFITRIYTNNEIALAKKFTSSKKISSFYAKRFAAKEALVKAIGTGFRRGVSFTDIEILNNEDGKPVVNLFNELKTTLADTKIHISLSDDYPFAIATILICISS